ncbi:unnamed protein product [Mytilus edulis]|uniref:Uncharacterized protein n=1 Tax=Mytilus edulis TaxID=6550 RepID=A0A8S3STK2_MYTED|nr:unnamed protein product [Mytilus edulis]
MHVDDFLWAGSEHFKKQVICQLRDKFDCGKELDSSFRYIGLNIQHEGNDIYLQQHDYTDELKQVDRAKYKNGIYPEIVGQLHWIATQSRPDLCFDVLDLSTSVQLSEAKTPSKSIYQEMIKLNAGESIPIKCFTDNKSLCQNIHSTKLISEKRLCLDLASIKESVSLGDITVTWIKTSSQISDCLTKAGADFHPLIKVLSTGKGP